MKKFLLCNLLALVIIALSPIHARAILSNDAQELKTLYEKLQKFKGSPKFHQVGFGRCCRFNKWMVKVETLGSKTGIEILHEVGFLPGDLITLGMEYMRSRGRPTLYSKEMEATIMAGLAPEPQLKGGQGVIITTDRGCASLDSIKKFIVAVTNKNYEEANTILSDPDCPRIYEKTIVNGPLDSKKLSWGIYHQVKLPDGTKLWMSGSQVKFKSKEKRK